MNSIQTSLDHLNIRSRLGRVLKGIGNSLLLLGGWSAGDQGINGARTADRRPLPAISNLEPVPHHPFKLSLETFLRFTSDSQSDDTWRQLGSRRIDIFEEMTIYSLKYFPFQHGFVRLRLSGQPGNILDIHPQSISDGRTGCVVSLHSEQYAPQASNRHHIVSEVRFKSSHDSEITLNKGLRGALLIQHILPTYSLLAVNCFFFAQYTAMVLQSAGSWITDRETDEGIMVLVEDFASWISARTARFGERFQKSIGLSAVRVFGLYVVASERVMAQVKRALVLPSSVRRRHERALIAAYDSLSSDADTSLLQMQQIALTINLFRPSTFRTKMEFAPSLATRLLLSIPEVAAICLMAGLRCLGMTEAERKVESQLQRYLFRSSTVPPEWGSLRGQYCWYGGSCTGNPAPEEDIWDSWIVSDPMTPALLHPGRVHSHESDVGRLRIRLVTLSTITLDDDQDSVTQEQLNGCAFWFLVISETNEPRIACRSHLTTLNYPGMHFVAQGRTRMRSDELFAEIEVGDRIAVVVEGSRGVTHEVLAGRLEMSVVN